LTWWPVTFWIDWGQPPRCRTCNIPPNKQPLIDPDPRLPHFYLLKQHVTFPKKICVIHKILLHPFSMHYICTTAKELELLVVAEWMVSSRLNRVREQLKQLITERREYFESTWSIQTAYEQFAKETHRESEIAGKKLKRATRSHSGIYS